MRPGYTQTLVVASQNPVKIEAARRGFVRMFPTRVLHLHPVAVPSDVRPQPLSDVETLQGALNRVEHAAHLVPQADYWVGIEGGVEDRQGSMEAFAWIVVSAPPLLGKAATSGLDYRRVLELLAKAPQHRLLNQIKPTLALIGAIS